MKVTVCIGSACHMQGAMEIIERLQDYIEAQGLYDEVELGGCMCTGQCRSGVCVRVDGASYSVTPQTADAFIQNVISGRAGA